MEILDDIITWASTLPLWQQVAVVKVLKQDEFTEQDYSSLADLCIEELRDPAGLKAKLGDPLQGYKHEKKEEDNFAVVVEAISNTRNINAIKDGSRLDFGSTGLTVVYGNNGVGKSGFTRIFKASCMCRDDEQVHGDVGKEEVEEPAATISYKQCNEPKTYEWTRFAQSDVALKTVHIFDSRAARVYLTDENDVKYVPAGLDIFDKLAHAFAAIKQVLEEKVAVQKRAMANLEPLFRDYSDTRAYELITNLDRKNIEKEISGLDKLTPEELAEIEKLKKQIAEKEANHPTKRQAVLRLKWQRYVRLNNMLLALKRRTARPAVDSILALRRSMFEAQRIAKQAQQQKFTAEEYLPGTGDYLWKELWQAAKDYSEQVAYQDYIFPHTDEGAKCVLCQRELDPETQARFVGFNRFMSDKSQGLAKNATKKFDEALDAFQEIDRIDPELINEVFAELEGEGYAEADKLRTLLSGLVDYHSKLLIEFKKEDEEIQVDQQSFDFESQVNFRQHIDGIGEEAKNFDITKFNDALRADKTTLAALESRRLLSKYSQEIAKEMQSFSYLKTLANAISMTDTAKLSRRGGELKKQYLEASLRDTFNAELQSIYRDGLIVELKQARTKYGVTYSEIVLSSATAPHGRIRPDEVMSESEQKVISLAGYFAELSLSPHTSSIVLDDPVTSLDHFNIERIANRIAKEATKRQVIVFTHNVVFTAHLIDEAEREGVALTAKTISKMPKPGNVSDGLPWDSTPVKGRIGKLKAKLQDLGAIYRRGDAEAYTEQGEFFYKKLRETWERSIEEHLFANVVKRYKRDIETSRLHSVKILDTDYETVHANMSRCSSFVHDSPDESTVQIPGPDVLEADLQVLVTWIEEIKKRQSK